MALILIVDGEYPLRHSLALEFRRIGHECVEAGSEEEARSRLDRRSPALLILDLSLQTQEANMGETPQPDNFALSNTNELETNGLRLLERIAKEYPETPIIATTAFATIDSAVTAMKLGAVEYLEKPLDLEEVALVVERVLRNVRDKSAAEAYRRNAQHNASEVKIVGSSPAIKNLLATIDRMSASLPKRAAELPTVLLQGETGTGKDLLAHYLHDSSPLASQPFVQINCSGLPRELVESELFGHEKGAFTGATQRKQGLFEVAAGGTIFLDEIGDMSVDLQSKLLGVLENRRFRRVGGTREYEADVRVIAATHKNLVAEIEHGQFRSDLYFRLKVLHLHLPPLRARSEDIPELAAYFMERFQRKYRRDDLELGADSLQRFCAWHWPGNIRELAHTIEHIVLMSENQILELPDFLETEDEHAEAPGPGFNFAKGDCTLDSIAKRLATEALEYTGGNVSEVARILNISRGALRNKLQKWGIKTG